MATLDRLSPGYAHFAAPIVPGQIYEVRPGKEIVLTGEVYFVKLTRETEATARVETFVISTWKARTVAAVRRCLSVTS